MKMLVRITVYTYLVINCKRASGVAREQDEGPSPSALSSPLTFGLLRDLTQVPS